MNNKDKNPLGMVPDPFDGKTFVLPETPCTRERRLFFQRMNEILVFLHVTSFSFLECRKNVENLIPKLPFREKTEIKIEWKGGRAATMPARKIVKMTHDGLDILARQIFIMIYGSFETYLFQIFERTYPNIGITKNILDTSLDILMKRKWDGKFCKMSEVFDVNYCAGDLMNRFDGIEMNFEGKLINNPLNFLDELTQIRHRIVHASSILEKGNLLSIDIRFFHEFFYFFSLLTDYIDDIFSKKFGYPRNNLDPAKA